MCGICGTWHLDGKSLDVEALEWAATRLRHRGPDDEGYLLAEPHSGRLQPCGGKDTTSALNLPRLESFRAGTFSIGLGFRRLAVLDLSPAGHQPMASADGRLWLVLNGEIYNYIELRQELAALGFTFRTATDSEVVLAAYQAWGAECLSRFNGMWAMAIWDSAERSLFLARDRFGVKPLYYVQAGNTFAFASEIKALVGLRGLPFIPEPQAVYNYISRGKLPEAQSGQTFFNGVHCLPAGHYLSVNLQRVKLQSYWSLDVQAEPVGDSIEPLLAPYQELFTDSVNLRLRSDVPVGTCLSGGLDSSAIVCIINREMAKQGFSGGQIGEQQRTFSAVYDQAGPFNERKYIDKVLAATNAQGMFAWPSAEKLRSQAAQMVWHQDEPFQSTSIFAQWCVMSKVRASGVTVLLDGQGADELLAGYRPFKYYLGDLLRANRFEAAWQAARAISAHTDLNGWRFLRSALADHILGTRPAWLRRAEQNSQRDTEYLAPGFRQSMQPYKSKKEKGRIISLDDHLRDQLENTSLPHLLRYEDRNSMAFSVEARLPYLDYRFVRYNFGAAAGWRVYDGWSKYILRRAMQSQVPGDIIWRKDKIGFTTPESAWLQEWLTADPDWLSEPWQSQDYLAVDAVKTRIRQWMDQGGELPALWRWMNLELWLRVWQQA